MIAVQGVYDNGRIQLSEAAPMEKQRLLWFFLRLKRLKRNR